MSPTNLGAELSSFVGREAELEAACARFEEGAALVTIRGPGGVGKTRLAREVARRLLEAHPGGVWFCEVGVGSEVDSIAEKIGRALGADPGESPVDSVGRSLAHRGPVLLLLDDCESSIDGTAALVSAWRELAPEARFLVSSRTPLALAAEREIELGPLDGASAAELFCERAAIDGASEVVGEIVTVLEGLPLAIELAAARTPVLGLEDLRKRLGDALELLRAKRRDRPPRHMTIRAAIDGSYEALDEPARAAFVQCACFEGGFTLDAAEAVLGLPGEASVLEALEALRDQSLLQVVEREGRVRFTTYALVRSYALERLGGAEVETRERHRAYFGALAERFAASIDGPALARSARFFDDELDNLKAALSTDPDPERAARVALALASYLSLRGPHTLRRLVLRRAAERGITDAALRLRIHVALADAERALGAYDAAVAQLDAIAPEAEALADAQVTGESWLVRGKLEQARRDAPASIESLKAARDAFARSGRRVDEGEACRLLAHAHMLATDLEAGRGAVDRAMSLAREADAPVLDAWCRVTSAAIAQAAGQLREAERRYGEAIERLEALGQHRDGAMARFNRALVRLEQDRLGEASAELAFARDRCAEVGDLAGEALVTLALAEAALFEGAWAKAAGLVEAAFPLYEALNSRWVLAELHAYRGACEAVRDRLPAARASFEEAERRVEGLDRPELLDASVDAMRAFLDRAEGDGERARERLSRLREPAEGGSLVERSTHLRLLERLLEGVLRDAPASLPRETLVAHADGRSVTLPSGAHIDLAKRPRLAAVMRLLIAHREAAPGEPLSRDELLEGGWPGEKVLERAGRNRVYVTLSTLRKLGLGEVLLTRGGGWLLDPRVAFEVLKRDP